MKTLIVVPDLSELGGVALHYKGLQNYWSENVVYLEQKLAINTNLLKKVYTRIYNYVKMYITYHQEKPTHVILNTSLKAGMYSQYMHFKLAKRMGLKTGVFIHGWDVFAEDTYLSSSRCKSYLGSCDGIFVLSTKFKDALRKYNYTKPIHLVTTKVDDTLIKGFDLSLKKFNNRRFLFVARLIKEKGIFEALAAFKIIQSHYPDASFSIVGDGADIAEVKEYVCSNFNSGVIVHGALSGNALIKEFSNADYYFLLSRSEGMPGSLLEAMSFGLIPIVRNVGGIPEIFEDGTNGIMSGSKDPNYFAKCTLELMKNEHKALSISKTNYDYSHSTFLASVVAKKMEILFESL